MNELSVIFSSSGVVGQTILFLLLTGVTIGCSRLYYWSKYFNERQWVPISTIHRAISEDKLDTRFLKEQNDPFCKIILATLRQFKIRGYGNESLDAHLKESFQENFGDALNSRIGTMQLMALACSILGMFGTCWGMMLSLKGFYAYENPTEALKFVMQSVSLAFSTTLLGLLSSLVLSVIKNMMTKKDMRLKAYLQGLMSICRDSVTNMQQRKAGRSEQTKRDEFLSIFNDISKKGKANGKANPEIINSCLNQSIVER